MEKLEKLPDGLTFVTCGTDHGVTWTRLTDGEYDYIAEYDVETKVETVYVVGPVL